MANSKELMIQYDPTDLLGKGGFGSVFRGKLLKEGEKTPMDVAVKAIQIFHGSESSSIDGREEEALIRLDHVNVVRLYHVENTIDNRFR